MKPGAKRQILFVAPESGEASALEAILSRIRADWQFHFVTSAAEALEQHTQISCDVLFAELKLPVGSGLALLDAIRQTHPQTLRFLCVRAPDQELIMQCAWNSHRLFTQLLTHESVCGAIERALELEVWLRNRSIQRLVSSMRTFPAIPSLYFRVLKELGSPNASLETLAQLIGGDLAISTKMIQVVNSFLYAQQRRISDLKEAVQILGFE